MQIKNNQHLSYCTNIHPGESWPETFSNLKLHTLKVKQAIAANQSFGIGLRLSNDASIELEKPDNLSAFKQWLKENDCYVFTMNGFPYGGFHDRVIKDKVHTPDWTTDSRLEYTKRLARILAELLPEGMIGGISTSPLSYRWWHDESEFDIIKQQATNYVMKLVLNLDELKKETGKSIHIDMEPEPDGLLETGQEFYDYYQQFLLGNQLNVITNALNVSKEEAKEIVREHIQLCFDICHFAVEYEDMEDVLRKYAQSNIPIGKIQISAALKVYLENQEQRQIIKEELLQFVEPNYLHQAVLRKESGQLIRFKDLDVALEEIENESIKELRTHYHVPLFTETYGRLTSTQEEIIALLKLWKTQSFCEHLEVETYTWGVLPESLKMDLDDSIIREMEWVINELQS